MSYHVSTQQPCRRFKQEWALEHHSKERGWVSLGTHDLGGGYGLMDCYIHLEHKYLSMVYDTFPGAYISPDWDYLLFSDITGDILVKNPGKPDHKAMYFNELPHYLGMRRLVENFCLTNKIKLEVKYKHPMHDKIKSSLYEEVFNTVTEDLEGD